MEPDRSDAAIGLIFEGRVQGVGFRWWAARAARRMGIRGTVRNRSDGSVELHACAPAEALRLFLSEVRQGPPAAHITAERQVPPASELPSDFRVIG